jgi:aspartate kinase
MKVFKFGGASVKDAEGVKRLETILSQLNSEGVVIVSAMGKMTNAFEALLLDFSQENLEFIKNFHLQIIRDLFHGEDKERMELLLGDMIEEIQSTYLRFKNASYDFLYDQIVSYGELLSTRIIHAYLETRNVDVEFHDARKLILTSDDYREAKIDWKETSSRIKAACRKGKLHIAQGFIAGTNNGLTSTLGREGSDFSAAIFAYTLEAESLSIWKDVEGVLNADPRAFLNAEKLDSMSYSEALELAYYGASVIHPKTLKPLKEKNIPLLVKSFMNPKSSGTTIQEGLELNPFVPCFVLKKNQILIDVEAKDFSFITEDHLQEIYQLLAEYKLKVNLQQNSALRLSVCLSDSFNSFGKFLDKLKSNYTVEHEENLELYTIRHKDPNSEEFIANRGELILKQDFNEVTQMLLKSKQG